MKELEGSSPGVKKITIRPYSNLPLMIIGNGRWSTKVQASLKSNLKNLNLSVHSSREFLQGGFDLRDAETTIWICSRPDVQLDILENLSGHEGLVVLEKPIARSRLDFENVKNTPNFKKNKLRFSRVWNYSNIWKEFISLALGKISRIEIKRGGPNHGSTIPLAQDWAPHDVFLLAELIGNDFLDFRLERNNSTGSFVQGLMTAPKQNLEILYEFGQFKETRVAEWIVQTELRGLVKLNFLNQEIYFEKGVDLLKTEPNDAISKMFLNFQNIQIYQNILAFNAQEFFWNQVFETDSL